MIKSRIDISNKWLIEGWAFDDSAPNKAVQIAIFQNGNLIKKSVCNILRKGLIKNNMHHNGKCGFNYYLGDQVITKPGDVISIKISDKEIKSYIIPPLSKSNPQIKKAKILVVGLGKSGTSKLGYIIKGAMAQNANMYFEPNGAKGLEDIHLHRNICKDKAFVHKSLYLFGKKIPFGRISNLYDKKVWILRDPRDRIISLMLYRWFKGHKPDPVKFQKVLKLLERKEKEPSSVSIKDIWQIVIPENKFDETLKKQIFTLCNILENLDNSWLKFSYNDMIDLKLENLNNHLGFDVKTAEEVPDKFQRVSRTKAYGNWKNWFTPSDVDFFKPIFDTFIKKYNLADSLWEINNPQILDPELGSKYALRLFNGNKK